MTLIWARDFTGDTPLARLWQQYTQAQAYLQNTSLSDAESGKANREAQQAKAADAAAVAKADASLKQAADNGQAYTHALVVGVGRYAQESLSVTTSVHGARQFAEWLLSGFSHPERPLGSVELLLSPTGNLRNWAIKEETVMEKL